MHKFPGNFSDHHFVSIHQCTNTAWQSRMHTETEKERVCACVCCIPNHRHHQIKLLDHAMTLINDFFFVFQLLLGKCYAIAKVSHKMYEKRMFTQCVSTHTHTHAHTSSWLFASQTMKRKKNLTKQFHFIQFNSIPDIDLISSYIWSR